MRDSLLSIGAVSKACDVPVETLRTWERRYGFPVATRTPGGQRLYEPETVELLLQAKRALESGLRPAQAFAQLTGGSNEVAPVNLARPLPTVMCTAEPCSESDGQSDLIVSRWLRAASMFDAASLAHGFEAEWHRLGVFDFLERRIHPFIVAIGEAWMRDEIGIAHEHFASDRVIDFLGTIWRPLSDAATGPVLVGATMPMEQHAIGLHMAAVTAAAAGCRIAYLGLDTPVIEIARAARQADASVFVSVSATAPRPLALDQVRELRRHLESRHQLAVGGGGARLDIEGVAVPGSFRAFFDWCTQQPLQRPSR
jgi:DNA-binding transcriptional MerR regulator/methanogenic corrinoid protein MtbC1